MTGMAKAVYPTKPGELLKARLNQPRVSSEELLRQMEEHKRASEEFFKAARNATSKSGRAKVVAG